MIDRWLLVVLARAVVGQDVSRGVGTNTSTAWGAGCNRIHSHPLLPKEERSKRRASGGVGPRELGKFTTSSGGIPLLGTRSGGNQDGQPGFVLAGVIFGWRGTVSGNFVHETSKRELAISGEWRRPKRIEGIELPRRSPAKNTLRGLRDPCQPLWEHRAKRRKGSSWLVVNEPSPTGLQRATSSHWVDAAGMVYTRDLTRAVGFPWMAGPTSTAQRRNPYDGCRRMDPPDLTELGTSTTLCKEAHAEHGQFASSIN
ncbi:hypothetical protein AUP68_06650 [Ilyonectria robusta]